MPISYKELKAKHAAEVKAHKHTQNKLDITIDELAQQNSDLIDALQTCKEAEQAIDSLTAKINAMHTQYEADKLHYQEQAQQAWASISYYETELKAAHALLGRTVHQHSERHSNLRIGSDYPTNNQFGHRSSTNPNNDYLSKEGKAINATDPF